MKTAKGRGPLASGYWLGPYFSAESSMALATAFSASAMIGGTPSSGKLFSGSDGYGPQKVRRELDAFPVSIFEICHDKTP